MQLGDVDSAHPAVPQRPLALSPAALRPAVASVGGAVAIGLGLRVRDEPDLIASRAERMLNKSVIFERS